MNTSPIEEDNEDTKEKVINEDILEPILKKTYTIFINVNNITS